MTDNPQTVNVLLVERGTTFSKFLELVLADDYCSSHFVVNTVKSVLAACESIRANGEPHILLLDLFLVDSEGLATFDLMRGETKAAILVITGSEDRAMAAELVRRGASDVVIKGSISGQQLVWRVWRTAQRVIEGFCEDQTPFVNPDSPD